MGNDRQVHRGETVQPGTKISAELWRRFRQDVKERRGRVNGVLAGELERALKMYLDAADGRNVEYELEEIREDLERVLDAVEGGGTPSRDDSKNKKSDSKDSVSGRERVTADGGVPVDDRHLVDDDDDDDRSVVERRTDAAVAELVATHNVSFQLDDLDAAIREGAGVGSKPSVRQYRERVLDRLGGLDEITHPALRDAPIDRRVFFVDDDELERLEAELEADRREAAEAEADELEAALEASAAASDD